MMACKSISGGCSSGSFVGGRGRPEFSSLLREDVQSGEHRLSYYSVGKKRKRRERRKVTGHFVSPHGIATEDAGSGGARTEGE
ncbi:hypothetical protein Tco_1267833 [Tanacetum coccineum]